jgi:TonB family protein
MPLLKTRSYYLSLLITVAFVNSFQLLHAQGNGPVSNSADSGKVFTEVEIPPAPIAGFKAFYSFIGSKIRYPAADKQYNIQGRVIVQFVIEKDGSLTDIKPIRSPSNTLTDETIRVLKMAPRWTPGIQNEKPVRVQYTIPVNFSLGDDNMTFAELTKYLSNAANYPDAVKSNKNPGLIVVEINITKSHISTVQINKGIADDLNQAVSNMVKSYPDEIKTRNGIYTFIFKFGTDTINTSTLSGYVKGDDVVAMIAMQLAKK